jgi:glycosyltransferase involved in cell wall biosynthesis
MPPRRIVHVFPYHPAQIHEDFDSWHRGQLLRWPLAAIAASGYADRSSVHLMGSRSRSVVTHGLTVTAHQEVLGGPRYWAWGDDWSWSLELLLRRLTPEDVCVVHLNWFWAAHAVERAAHRCRVVVVVHGTHLGPWDTHLAAADAIVVIRADHVDQLVAMGAERERVTRLIPSIDKEVFRPGARPPSTRVPRKLGFIGRLSREKGLFEIPAVIRAVREAGIDVAVELVGKGDEAVVRQFNDRCEAEGVAGRVRFLGGLTPRQVAAVMHTWDLFLMPRSTRVAPSPCSKPAPAAFPSPPWRASCHPTSRRAVASGALPAASSPSSPCAPYATRLPWFRRASGYRRTNRAAPRGTTSSTGCFPGIVATCRRAARSRAGVASAGAWDRYAVRWRWSTAAVEPGVASS